MQRDVNAIKGLKTYKNELTQPEGSLIQADNIIIDRDNVAEPRRGFKVYNDFTDIIAPIESREILQTMEYRDRLLIHRKNGTSNILAYEILDQDGSLDKFESFVGTYDPVDDGLRIKSERVQGNLLFTTSHGVKKISATSASEFASTENYIVDAGAPRAHDVILVEFVEDIGFMPKTHKTAYRGLWSYTDHNDILVQGEPSSRIVFENEYLDDAGVKVKIVIPYGVLPGYVFKLFRSSTSLTPDDEYQLVYEYTPTTDDFTNKYFEYTDSVEDNDRIPGEYLYTNELSRDGETSSKAQPPRCHDIATYQDHTFYANCDYKYKKYLTMLSTEGILSGTQFRIARNGVTETFEFGGANNINILSAVGFTGNGTAEITRLFAPYDYGHTYTSQGKYARINSAFDSRSYYAWLRINGSTDFDPKPLGLISVPIDVNLTKQHHFTFDTPYKLEKLSAPINPDILRDTYQNRYITFESNYNGITTDFYIWFEVTYFNEVLTTIPTGYSALSGKAPIKIELDSTQMISGGTEAREISNQLELKIEDNLGDLVGELDAYSKCLFSISHDTTQVAGGTITIGQTGVASVVFTVAAAETAGDYIKHDRYNTEQYMKNIVEAINESSLSSILYAQHSPSSDGSVIGGTIMLIAKNVGTGSIIVTEATSTITSITKFINNSGAPSSSTPIKCMSGDRQVTVFATPFVVLNDAKYYNGDIQYTTGLINDRCGLSTDTAVQIRDRMDDELDDLNTDFSSATFSSVVDGITREYIKLTNTQVGTCTDTSHTTTDKRSLWSDVDTQGTGGVSIASLDQTYFILQEANGKKYKFWYQTIPASPVPVSETVDEIVKIDGTSGLTTLEQLILKTVNAVNNTPDIKISAVGELYHTPFTGTMPQNTVIKFDGIYYKCIVANSSLSFIESEWEIIEGEPNAVYFYCLENGPTESHIRTIYSDVAGILTTELFQLGSLPNDNKVVISPYGLIDAVRATRETAISLVNTINQQSNMVRATFRGFANSQTEFAEFELEELTYNTTPFTMDILSQLQGFPITDNFSPELPTTADKELYPNILQYSTREQPEACPKIQQIVCGAKESPIMRILALRDSLFVFKTDSIWRISGTSANNFSATLTETSAQLLAADSAQVLNNRIYALTSQGVILLTEGGISIISRDIESQILTPTNKIIYADFAKYTFAVPYEGDRSYLLWLPTKKSDDVATQCFRYNVFTQAWTRWTIPATCGLVNNRDQRMYLGSGTDHALLQERKDLKRTDYADREYDITINGTNLKSSVWRYPSGTTVNVGDVIYQKQWLTISRYNRLLKKLDREQNLPSSYLDIILDNTITQDMSAALSRLVLKLQADDPGSGYVHTPSTDLYTQALEYNDIVLKLKNSSLTNFTGYNPLDLVNGQCEYEAIVSSVNPIRREVALLDFQPFISGEATLFKSIPSIMYWAHDHLGAPSSEKHLTQATLMFDQYNFNNAEMLFKTDIHESENLIEFLGEGTGVFGSKTFGDYVFGGEANQRPFRTYIPRDVSRCRYINIGFRHNSARESFALLGYSITAADQQSERAYR